MVVFPFILCLVWFQGIFLVRGYVDIMDLQQDNQTLHRGSNLMYFSLGSQEHNKQVAQSVISSFEVQEWGCYDAHQHILISDHIHDTNPNEHVKLIIVHGLECLSSTERRALDFAYRLTDSSSDISNVIILFNMKFSGAVTSTESSISSAHNLKLKLAEALNEDSVFFNGHAFTGRLTRTFFESNDLDIEIPAPSCAALVRDDMCKHLHSVGTNNLLKPTVIRAGDDYTPYIVGGVVIIGIILVLVTLLSRKSTGEQGSTTSIQGSVAATVHGQSSLHSDTYMYASGISYNPHTPVYSYSDTHNTTYATNISTAYTTNATSEESPSRRGSVVRRSLTRMQMKQLNAHNNSTNNTATNSTTNPTSTTTNTHTTTTPTTNTHTTTKDRRSTGSIHARHKTTSPSGEEAVVWAGPDSNVHDTRSKKHTRSSARF